MVVWLSFCRTRSYLQMGHESWVRIETSTKATFFDAPSVRLKLEYHYRNDCEPVARICLIEARPWRGLKMALIVDYKYRGFQALHHWLWPWVLHILIRNEMDLGQYSGHGKILEGVEFIALLDWVYLVLWTSFSLVLLAIYFLVRQAPTFDYDSAQLPRPPLLWTEQSLEYYK